MPLTQTSTASPHLESRQLLESAPDCATCWRPSRPRADDTIVLGASEFDQYVRDVWTWSYQTTPAQELCGGPGGS
jgi:hypothetical protein